MPDVVDDHATRIARTVVTSTSRMRPCESEREFARAADARVIRDTCDAPRWRVLLTSQNMNANRAAKRMRDAVESCNDAIWPRNAACQRRRQGLRELVATARVARV
jgi:hypothetical protein